MTATRVEHDSLGPVSVPADNLWGAQTQRSLEHFSIGDDLMPREMIPPTPSSRRRPRWSTTRPAGSATRKRP